jgi:hypothetical protein
MGCTGAHCGETGNPSGLLALSEWFDRMPVKEWKATLKTIANSRNEIESLRVHTRTGRPLGNDAFLSRIETFLGRRVRPLPIGRQKGWRKAKAAMAEDGENSK